MTGLWQLRHRVTKITVTQTHLLIHQWQWSISFLGILATANQSASVCPCDCGVLLGVLECRSITTGWSLIHCHVVYFKLEKFASCRVVIQRCCHRTWIPVLQLPSLRMLSFNVDSIIGPSWSRSCCQHGMLWPPPWGMPHTHCLLFLTS